MNRPKSPAFRGRPDGMRLSDEGFSTRNPVGVRSASWVAVRLATVTPLSVPVFRFHPLIHSVGADGDAELFRRRRYVSATADGSR